MSLRVWLPLNGSLENQGLDNITVTNNGATVNNNGKIGKCYSFPASGGNLTLPASVMKNFVATNGCSVTFWIKLNAWCSSYQTYFQAGIGGLDWNNYIFGILRNSTASKICFSICDGSSYSGASYLTSDWVVGEWMHVAFIYETGKCKIYLNGELDKEYTTTIVPKFANITKITIGRCNNESGYPTNCLMNDFRIYDNALSPQEVKKISQGLVLHYLLNRNGWGQENLITGYDTSFLSYPNGVVTLFSNQMNGGVQEIVSNIEGAIKCLHLHSNGGNDRQYGRFSATSGKSYTISCDYYSTSSQAVPFRGELNGGDYSWAGSNAVAYTTPNKWVRLSFSYLNLTSSATIYYFMQCSQNTDCYIKNLKIEEGSIPTPWCPNSSDALADTLGLNNNIQYDASGYCNNGTKINELTYTSDTPKYNVSTHFGAANQKIRIDNLITTGFGNSYTFAWWGKRNSNAPMFWGFSNGIRLNGMYQGILWNTGDGGNNLIYKPNTTTTITAPSLNEWHHYVMIGDGIICKLYLDGELYGQAKVYKAISGTSIFINGWDGSTSYGHNDMDMSDFRIYATALSAEDVLSLYQNEAVIESDGTIRGKIR